MRRVTILMILVAVSSFPWGSPVEGQDQQVEDPRFEDQQVEETPVIIRSSLAPNGDLLKKSIQENTTDRDHLREQLNGEA